jgi:GNAT superfamily N-acetyltransferase
MAESVPGSPAAARWPIRPLGRADLPDCVALALDRDWGPEERKWSLLLDVGEGYGIDDPDGGLAGAVVLTRYGRRLAAVGMMLVASRRGGRGLGRALMTHLLGQADGATVFLYATPYGRPLYGKLGFRTIGTATTMLGHFTPDTGIQPGPPTRPASEQDLATILRIDASAFGADRGHVVGQLFAFAERVCVLEGDQGIEGYAAAWRNGSTLVIGPVVAPGDAGAQALITALAAGAGSAVRLDPDPTHPELTEWIRAHGLDAVNTNAFMVRGAWPPPGGRRDIFAPLSVAMG